MVRWSHHHLFEKISFEKIATLPCLIVGGRIVGGAMVFYSNFIYWIGGFTVIFLYLLTETNFFPKNWSLTPRPLQFGGGRVFKGLNKNNVE